MNRLFIEATKATPRVEFLPNGELTIHGRSLPENPASFYAPILSWIDACTLEKISIEIRMEYFNTSSSKQIFSLFCNAKKNTNIKDIEIKWYYEEGDEDGYEVGREFESMINLPFNFHEYAENLV